MVTSNKFSKGGNLKTKTKMREGRGEKLHTKYLLTALSGPIYTFSTNTRFEPRSIKTSTLLDSIFLQSKQSIQGVENLKNNILRGCLIGSKQDFPSQNESISGPLVIQRKKSHFGPIYPLK